MCADRLRDLPPMTLYEADYVPPVDPVPDDEHALDIHREGDVWVVEGEWLYNLMGCINFDDRDSLRYFQRVIRSSGAIERMQKAGIADGDTVSMYDLEFDFVL